MTLKKTTKRVLTALAAIFLLLFALRFAWNLATGTTRSGQRFDQRQFEGGMTNAVQESIPNSRQKSNYASAKIAFEPAGAPQPALEQKYERVSDLTSSTDDFARDSRKAYETAKARDAVIQDENLSGLDKARTLRLSFGVRPDKFEELTEALRTIGTATGFYVIKTDKTADYRALEAKRLSLEKTRDGLRALKVPGAPLSDLMALETKILEIEGQIQELGVSLGDFSEDNSFCTVRFYLFERNTVSLPSRILAAFLDALSWTLYTFLATVAALLFALLSALLGTLVIEKILAVRQNLENQKGTKHEM